MSAPTWAIVIGGSAGALAPLRTIVAGLPPDMPAACFVVLHTSASGGIFLPDLLRRVTRLPVSTVEGAERTQAGRIYLPAADRHLRVTAGGVQSTREMREHHMRPAVDVLFRSAARAFPGRTIGIVLSGYGGDGAAGAISIHAHGGTVIVQDPSEADVPGMPERTISATRVDHVAAAAAIVEFVRRVMSRAEVAAGGPSMADEEAEVRRVIAEDIHEQERGARSGMPAVITCPDCGGTLWQTDEGNFVDFSCHIGHRYSSDTLLVQKTEQLEAALVTALRLLREKSILLRQTAERARGNGQDRAAARLDEQAAIDDRYAEVLRRDLLEAEPSALSNAAVDEEVRRVAAQRDAS
jgi:two-component system, chemotaxis family, protein-glutamate methylesterase/glutaminase